VNDDARRRAASIATGTSAVLIAAKVALALVTGSVAALAEATHAAAELLRTIVAAFAARDEGRPGGTPASAGALEGWIVVVAGVVAAFASLRTLGGHVDVPLVGVAGLLACALLARLVAAHVSKVADATGSAALAADARSLRSSQATAVLAAGALTVVVLVGKAFPDVVGGLLISVVVVRVGVELIQAARPGNERIGGAELAAISEELAAGPPEIVGYGRVVGRTASGVRRIDIDVTLQAGVNPRRMAHIAQVLRAAIGQRVPGCRIVLHLRKPDRPSRKARVRGAPPRQ
jgi:divalent metal cation (Fe/Co/Zn/Cd) transporter